MTPDALGKDMQIFHDPLSRSSQKRLLRRDETKKTKQNLEKWPESLAVMLKF